MDLGSNCDADNEKSDDLTRVTLNRYYKIEDSMGTRSSVKSGVKPNDNISSMSKGINSCLRSSDEPQFPFNPPVASKQSEEAVENQERLNLLKQDESVKYDDATNSDATVKRSMESVNSNSKQDPDDVTHKKRRLFSNPNVKNSLESRLKRGPLISILKTTDNRNESIRQRFLDEIYTTFCEDLPEPIARQKAIKEEQIIHWKATKKYKRYYKRRIFRLRKQSLEKIMRNPAEIDFPDEIREIPVYDLLAEHILTEEQYVINGYPLLVERGSTIAKISPTATYYKSICTKKDGDFYICIKCKLKFIIDTNGFPIMNGERCWFHSSRLQREPECDGYYPCCLTDESDAGCTSNQYHLPDTFNEDRLEGFVETQDPPRNDIKKEFYALDCEMCFTTAGVELTRVTVVDRQCNVKFESYVKPLNVILDYCTKYSGITEEKLNGITKTVVDIQQDLMNFIFKDTILIGHSLENDLKSLKIVHRNVVDTSVMYPHTYAPYKKFALKDLAENHINMIIQEGESGHDSAEDAIACMKLVWKKLKNQNTNMNRR